MVKGLGRTPDLERSGPETKVVIANSVKHGGQALPCSEPSGSSSCSQQGNGALP